ncbi:N-acetyltransferase [Lacibacter luteus]|uniref:N-acetyltransferase n=1 Tax=Lacibacter luteus TaxID=2508719 RepID=A0A4Q1CIV0_9BACT|nr:GNAT family protein [Lacibacter luteus]RXK60509.1 N-acetyltransferase [Lacibacter luteus]
MIEKITDSEIVLENDRVLLRPLKESDFENLLVFALHEADLWKYSLISPAGEEGMKNYISTTLQNKVAGIEYPFIVFDKATQQYAGSTRFYDIQPFNKTTQLGYTWYGKAFQRTGLNRNCKQLLFQFAFEKWGLERVELRADANNQPSINAMKAIGCTVEGILRSNMTIEAGGRRDSIILSILKTEWFGSVKQLLQQKIR